MTENLDAWMAEENISTGTPATVDNDMDAWMLDENEVAPTPITTPTKHNRDEKPQEMARIDSAIQSASQKYGVPPARIKAHIDVETGGTFNPNSKNPKSSASGLMQTLKSTGEAMGITNPFNIEQSVEGGTKYLRQLHDIYGDWDAASQAYHDGPSNFQNVTIKGGFINKDSENYLSKIHKALDKYDPVEKRPLPEINAPGEAAIPPERMPEVEAMMTQEEEDITVPEEAKPVVSAMRLVRAGKEGGKDVLRSMVIGTGAVAVSGTAMSDDQIVGLVENPDAFRAWHDENMARAQDTGEMLLNDSAAMFQLKNRYRRIKAAEEAGVASPNQKISKAGMSLVEYGMTAEWLQTNEEYYQSSGWLEDLIRATPQVATQILVGGIAYRLGGPGASQAAGSALMLPQLIGGTYEGLIRDGVPHKIAIKQALISTMISLPLEQIGIGKTTKLFGLRKGIQKKLMAMVEASGSEGVTEFLQTYPEAAANLVSDNPDEKYLNRLMEVVSDPKKFKEALHSASIGATLGLGGSGVAVASQNRQERRVKKAKDKARANKIELLTSQMTDFSVKDVIALSKEAKDKTVREAAKRELDRRKKERAEKKKTEPAKPKPKKKVNKELENIKKTNKLVEEQNKKAKEKAKDESTTTSKAEGTTQSKSKAKPKTTTKTTEKPTSKTADEILAEVEKDQANKDKADFPVPPMKPGQKVPSMKDLDKKEDKAETKEAKLPVKKPVPEVTAYSDMNQLYLEVTDKDGKTVKVTTDKLKKDFNPSTPKEFLNKYDELKAKARAAGYNVDGAIRGIVTRKGKSVTLDELKGTKVGKKIGEKAVAGAKKVQAAREKDYAQQDKDEADLAEKRTKELTKMRNPTDTDRAFFADVMKQSGYAANSVHTTAFGKTMDKADLKSMANEAVWKWIRKTPKAKIAEWQRMEGKDRAGKRALAKQVARHSLMNAVNDRIAKLNNTNRNKLRTMVEAGEFINTEEPTATGSVENISAEGTDTGVPEEGSTTSREGFQKKFSRLSERRRKQLESGEVKRYKGKRAERQYKRAQRRAVAKKEAAIRIEKARAKKTALGGKKESQKSNTMERRSALEQSKALKAAAIRASKVDVGTVSEDEKRVPKITSVKSELNAILDEFDNLVLERKGIEGGDKRLSKAEQRIVDGPQPIAKRQVTILKESDSPLEKAGKDGIPEYANEKELKKEFRAYSATRVGDPKALEKHLGPNTRIFKVGNAYSIGNPGVSELTMKESDPMIMISPMSSGKHAAKAANYIKELDAQIQDKNHPFNFVHEFNLRNGVNYVLFDNFETLKNSDFWKSLPNRQQINWEIEWKKGVAGLHSVLSNKTQTQRYIFVNIAAGRTVTNTDITTKHEAVHAFESIQAEKLNKTQLKAYRQELTDLYKTYKYTIEGISTDAKGVEEQIRWQSFFAQVDPHGLGEINTKELIAYMWSDPVIAQGLAKVMTEYKLKNGKVIRKSFFRRMTETILNTIIPQGINRRANFIEKATEISEHYLGITPSEIKGAQPKSIYSLREVQEVQIPDQPDIDIGDENIHEVLEDLQNLTTDFAKEKTKDVPLSAKAELLKNAETNDQIVEALMMGQESPNRLIHKAADWLDIEAPWKRRGYDKVGNVLKRFFSKRTAQQIQGVKEAEKVLNIIKRQFGNNVSREMLGKSMLAYEDRAFLEAEDDKGNKLFTTEDKKRLEPVFQAYDDFFKYTEAIYKARGVNFNLKKRLYNETLAKLENATDPVKRQRYMEDLDIIERSEYVHIPLRILFKEAIRNKAKLKRSSKSAETLEKATQALNSKMRRTKTLTSLIQSKKSDIQIEHVNPVEIIMNYMDKFAKDMAMLDIRDSLIESGLATKTQKGKKGKRPGTNFTYIDNKVVKGYSFLKGHWVDNQAIQTLNNVLEMDESQSAWEKGLAIAKMSSFYNPIFLPMYDVYQSAMSGAMLTGGPHNIPKNVGRAFKHVFKQDQVYMQALDAGLFSKPFDYPFKEYKRQMVQTLKHSHKNGLSGFAARQLGEFLSRTADVKQFSFLGALYNASWNIAWKLDETIRMFTYLQLKGRKGWDSIKAAEVAAKFHGDYASVPTRTRRHLNKVFFTPTFKIAMAKTYKNMVVGTLKTLVGKGTDVDKQYAAGLASLVGLNLAFDAVMRSLGWEPDDDAWYNFGRRYTRSTDSEWGPKEITFTWSNPGNLVQRYASRIAQSSKKDSTVDMMFDIFKWDLHPLYTTMFSLRSNRTPVGGQVWDEFDSRPIKIAKQVGYLTTNVIKITETIPGEFRSANDPLGTKLARDWRKENDQDLLYVLTEMPFLAFASLYAKHPKKHLIIRDLNRLKAQHKKDQTKYARMHDGAYNEEWQKNYEARIYRLVTELEKYE